MSRIRLALLVFCLVVPALSQAADGSAHLYLQPLPPEAARLSFALDSVSAVSDRGSEYPLEVRLQVVRQADAAKQRLLASGRLPAGSYTGFVFRVKRAALKSEQGEVALAVPDAGVMLDVPFTVGEQNSPLFWLTLDYQKSLSAGYGFSPVFSAVTPARPIAGRAAFVSNSGSNTITVVDKILGQAVAVIDTCAGPSGMALDHHLKRLFVACARDDEIQRIDVASASVTERSRLMPGDGPREVALTPDGRTLISVNTGSSTVNFFDTASLVREERIDVGSGPRSILVDAAGKRAFVFNTLSGSISIIDVTTRRLVATITTDASPLRGQFNGRGDRLYVIHERSPYMTVVDPRQLTILTRARLRTGAGSIKVDTVRDLVYLGSGSDPVVEFYDPNALMPINSLKTRVRASYLALDAEQSRLYVVSPDTNSLVIGSVADRKVVSEVDVGEAPYWVSVMGEK